MRHHRHGRLNTRSTASVFIAAALMFIGDAAASAQSCNTMTGGTNCNAGRGGPIDYSTPGPVQDRSAQGRAYQSGGVQSIGGSLSQGDDPPATLGAITFGANGRRCGGLFRSGQC